MSNKKLMFITAKKAPHNYNSKKLIFKKSNNDQIGTSKERFSEMEHAIKPSKLTQKQLQDQRSLGVGVNHGLHTRSGIGLYPVPTGRILRRYAQSHNLMPISAGTNKILNELPLSLKGILKNPRPPQKHFTDRQKTQMTYDQLVSTSSKRYIDPFADSDNDGVVNMFDCRPLNKKKQDEEFDKYGNTLQPREYKQKEGDKFIPIRNAKISVEVEADKRQIETEDQLGYEKGKGSDTASKNITKITKKWKADKS